MNTISFELSELSLLLKGEEGQKEDEIRPIFGFLGFTKFRSTCCKQDNGRAVQASLPFPSFFEQKALWNRIVRMKV